MPGFEEREFKTRLDECQPDGFKMKIQNCQESWNRSYRSNRSYTTD